MGATIGQILPLAVGVAISPIPIIATILMLLAPKAKAASVGFLIGWLAGIVVAVVVFTLLSSVLPAADQDGTDPIGGVIKILLGLLLLFLAWRQWRGRPAAGQAAELPGWMSAIDAMTAGRALGLGFLLAAVNPKNLLLAASAGITVGSAGLAIGEAALVVVIFTVIAGCTVLVPVVGYLVAAKRLAEPLDRLRAWLVANNATIMSVLLLVLGVVVVGKGIGSF